MNKSKKENQNPADNDFQEKIKSDKPQIKNNDPEYIDPDDLGEEDLSNGYAGEDTLDTDYGYPGSAASILEENKDEGKKKS